VWGGATERKVWAPERREYAAYVTRSAKEADYQKREQDVHDFKRLDMYSTRDLNEFSRAEPRANATHVKQCTNDRRTTSSSKTDYGNRATKEWPRLQCRGCDIAVMICHERTHRYR
jgi:hypothetical protein